MAELKPTTLLLLILSALLVFSWMPTSFSAKKLTSNARRGDIPYIKCQVCEKLAIELHQQVQKKQSQISPKKVSELQVIEIAENVCNLKKEEADWILRMDIVKNDGGLKLVDRETEGQCNTQCKTVERACQDVMGYYDTDVAEYIFKSKPQIESLVNYLCSDLSEACTVNPPPLPKDWTPAEPFVAKSAKEAEMEKLMKSMQGMPGAPGMKMYSKEDLLNNNFGDDENDEEEEEEDDFPSKLGKVLKEKETTKGNWQQKIVKRLSETGETVKKHASKISGKIQQWWTETGSGKRTKSESEL